MTGRWLLIAATAAGCAPSRGAGAADSTLAGTPAAAPAAPVAAQPIAPPDSLVLMAKDRTQVWLTEGRTSHDSLGKPCYERGVEIRRDSTRIRVPLLYTGRPPTLAGPDRLEAELWLDCRPIGRYRVDLATGRPTKIGR